MTNDDRAALSAIANISEWIGLSGGLIKDSGNWGPECEMAHAKARTALATLGRAVFDRAGGASINEGG